MLDRENPNVARIAQRGWALVSALRERLAEGRKPTRDEAQIYQEVVFYLLYDRFEDAFERVMTAPVVDFYDDFVARARSYLHLPLLSNSNA